MLVLGVETSCDETAVALYDTVQGLLANTVYSQFDIHAAYGGVVPELASRDHVRKLIPLLQATLSESRLSISDIGGVAYTAGPGLIGALLVGAVTAKSLAYSLNLPSIGVHHMEAHLLAVELAEEKPEYPFLALLVSGGHTMLIDVQAPGSYHILGESLDDAAGEAFDKTAKLLGLPYPGGPNLAKLAEQGDAKRFNFTRPMMGQPGLNFSFSGLKTQVLNTLQAETATESLPADLAASFQETMVMTLIGKIKRAIEQTGLKRIAMMGGVSANQLLRQRLHEVFEPQQVQVFYPPLAYCTDNAAMVAYTGALRLQHGQHDTTLQVEVKPRWPMTELTTIGD